MQPHIRTARRRRVLLGSLAAGVLLLAACGSDDDSTSGTVSASDGFAVTSAPVQTPTAATLPVVPMPTDLTDDTMSDDTMSDDTMSDDTMSDGTFPDDTSGGTLPVQEFDPSGLDDTHVQVVELTLRQLAQAGLVIDVECFVDIVAQLSDEDAQLIAAAGPEGSPELSAEGEALGERTTECLPAT